MRFSGGQYRPLSAEQVRQLHEAYLNILENVGCCYEKGLEPTVDMRERAGVVVDHNSLRVTFPRGLIEEQIARAPERVVLYGREEQHHLDLGEDRVHMGAGGAAIKILDLDIGHARYSTLKDLYLLGRLVDRLENIDFFLRPCVPLDIPETAHDENIFYPCFKATGKHVMGRVSGVEGFRKVLDWPAWSPAAGRDYSPGLFRNVALAFPNQGLDFLGRGGAALRELAHLVGYHGKTPPERLR